MKLRCLGITKTGTRCLKYAASSKEFCNKHSIVETECNFQNVFEMEDLQTLCGECIISEAAFEWLNLNIVKVSKKRFSELEVSKLSYQKTDFDFWVKGDLKSEALDFGLSVVNKKVDIQQHRDVGDRLLRQVKNHKGCPITFDNPNSKLFLSAMLICIMKILLEFVIEEVGNQTPIQIIDLENVIENDDSLSVFFSRSSAFEKFFERFHDYLKVDPIKIIDSLAEVEEKIRKK
jgi:hypothetical protein